MNGGRDWGAFPRHVEGDDIEARERGVRMEDVTWEYVPNDPTTDLVFIVHLATTAAPENRDKVAERFEDELKLQFGSAVRIRREGTTYDGLDSERARRH